MESSYPPAPRRHCAAALCAVVVALGMPALLLRALLRKEAMLDECRLAEDEDVVCRFNHALVRGVEQVLRPDGERVGADVQVLKGAGCDVLRPEAGKWRYFGHVLSQACQELVLIVEAESLLGRRLIPPRGSELLHDELTRPGEVAERGHHRRIL